MSKTTTSIFSLLIGFSAGVITGILFAPEEGKNTRDKLSFRLSKYRNELKDLIKHLSEEEAKPENTARTEGNKVISDMKNQAMTLLEDLEQLKNDIAQEKNKNQ